MADRQIHANITLFITHVLRALLHLSATPMRVHDEDDLGKYSLKINLILTANCTSVKGKSKHGGITDITFLKPLPL